MFTVAPYSQVVPAFWGLKLTQAYKYKGWFWGLVT